jgi:hypothetical protein
LTDGLIGHGDATLEQEFLHVAVAQGEAIVKPDPVADDVAGKAVVFVARGVGRRGHAGLPILGFIRSLRGGIAREIMSRLRKDGQQVDNACGTS